MHQIKKSMWLKIGTYILIMINVFVCILAYKYHVAILDKIIMRNPHYIILKEDLNRELLKEDIKILDIQDLKGAPKRAMEQGGATLVYVFPQEVEPGDYYCRVSAYKNEGVAGILNINFRDDKTGKDYFANTLVTDEEVEYSFIIHINTEVNRFIATWDNNQNVPTITDLQMCQLNEKSNMDELDLGVRHKSVNTSGILLTEDDKISVNSVDRIVKCHNNIFCVSGNKVKQIGTDEENSILASDIIFNITDDIDGNLYLVLQNGQIQKIGVDGSNVSYTKDLFCENPVSVQVYNGYWFVAEGTGGLEIFRENGNDLVYLSNVFDNNGSAVEKICIYNHGAYILMGGNVYWYDMTNVLNPIAKLNTYGGGNVTDIKTEGNNLFVALSNGRSDLDKGYHFSGEKGAGYYVYNLQLNGEPRLLDGWKIDGNYYDEERKATIDAIGNMLCYTLHNEGVRVYEVTDMNSNKKQKNSLLDVILYIQDGEDIVKIKESIINERGVYILTDKGDVYFWENSVDVFYNSTNYDLKCNESVVEYKLDINFENEISYDSTVLEQGQSVKKVVILKDYFVVGYNNGISIYSKKNKECLFKQKVNVGENLYDCSLLSGTKVVDSNLQQKSLNNYLYCGKKEDWFVYEVTEHGLVLNNSLKSAVGTINSVYQSFNNEYIICGESGVAIYDSECMLKYKCEGTEIEKLLGETSEAYFFFSKDCQVLYIDKEKKDKLLEKVLIQIDDGEKQEDYSKFFIWPDGMGYFFVSLNLYENEQGKYLIKNNEVVPIVKQGGEINWNIFRPYDMHSEENNIYVDVHNLNNKLFIVDISDKLNPQRIAILKPKARVYDLEQKDGTVIIAAGREGAIILERKD